MHKHTLHTDMHMYFTAEMHIHYTRHPHTDMHIYTPTCTHRVHIDMYTHCT